MNNLNDDNFIEYAAQNYNNIQHCDSIEFYDDLSRFKYIKKLFSRYEESGDLKERLILNHIIILYNVFGIATTKMLFLKLENYVAYLKPFLELLGYLPKEIGEIDFKTINTDNIKSDSHIEKILKSI